MNERERPRHRIGSNAQRRALATLVRDASHATLARVLSGGGAGKRKRAAAFPLRAPCTEATGHETHHHLQPQVLTLHMTDKRYDPAGLCIYCGRSTYSDKQPTRKFGDEHIIPFSLGGTLILPDASCETCERIINKVETNLTKGMFLPARTQLLYPTRNKKDRPKHLPLDIQADADMHTRQIPIEDYPGMIVTLRFSLPLALLGTAPVDEELTGGVAIATLPAFGENLNKHPRRTVTRKMGGDAATLGRLIAKIAHAYAVAEIGLGRFSPYLLDIILNRPPLYLKHYVGGEIGDAPPAGADRAQISHSLERLTDGTTLVLVKIRLFADRNGMPTYLAVAGHLTA
jgi:hypothetical protein